MSMWRFDLLAEKNHWRTKLAEQIAADVASEKLDLIVKRPHEWKTYIRYKETPIARFLDKYHQTLDFFALWPKSLITAHEQTYDLIDAFFKKSGLNSYFDNKNKDIRQIISIMRAYGLEVKSFIGKTPLNETKFLFSSNQQQLLKILKENPPRIGTATIDLIIAMVIFTPPFQASVKFYDKSGKIIQQDAFLKIEK